MHDLVVVGAGPGGYVAAIRAAQLGLRTAVVDRRAEPGGVCLNVGCIPSKALLDSSHFYQRIRRDAAAHGIVVTDARPDVAVMQRRKEQTVARLQRGIRTLLQQHEIELLTGTAAFRDERTLVVTDATGTERQLRPKQFILATGSEPIELPQAPFDGVHIVGSTEALAFPTVCNSLLVVGGGAIGLELGSVWSRLGAKVTVLELMPEILPGCDPTVARTMRRILTKQGMTIRTGTRLQEARLVNGRLVATVVAADESATEADGKQPASRQAGGQRQSGAKQRTSNERRAGQPATEQLTADKLLVCVGRRPRLDALQLTAAGLTPDERSGTLPVGDDFRTAQPHIFAVGDLIGGPMLAHKAEDEGIAAAEIIAGMQTRVRHDTIPSVVYTAPEVATVGRHAAELKRDGIPHRSASFPLAGNGRALAMGESDGSVTIVGSENGGSVLGAQIIAPNASDLIAEIVTVMEFGGSPEDIGRTPHAHPTLSEAIREAALGVDGRAIHKK